MGSDLTYRRRLLSDGGDGYYEGLTACDEGKPKKIDVSKLEAVRE